MARSRPVARLGRRWSTSARAASDAEAEHLDAMVRGAQPCFWPAVVADAAITARYRGEHHDFRSGADALVQVIRLCWVTESFFAQVCYRLRTDLRNRRVPVVPTLLHHISVVAGHVTIGERVIVHPGLYLPHGQVVVDGLTTVGADAVLRPFVTIGLRDGDPVGPTLGARVRVGTGAKIFGPVKVGDDVRVGANAVVLRDVPAGAVAVGVPARVRTS